MIGVFSSLFRWFLSLFKGPSLRFAKRDVIEIKQTNDSSFKPILVGKEISVHPTHIEEHINISLSSPEATVSSSFLHSSSHEKPLSHQAVSIMKQLAQSGQDGLVTWQPSAFIEELITKNNQVIALDDIDTVEDDLNCLVDNSYLRSPKACSSGVGSIYDLTIKGKHFCKTLLEDVQASENKGNTSI